MVEVQNLLLYSLVPSLTPNLLNNLCEFDQGHVKDFFCNGLCRLFYELLKNKESYLATDIQTKTEKLAAISYFSLCNY